MLLKTSQPQARRELGLLMLEMTIGYEEGKREQGTGELHQKAWG